MVEAYIIAAVSTTHFSSARPAVAQLANSRYGSRETRRSGASSEVQFLRDAYGPEPALAACRTALRWRDQVKRDEARSGLWLVHRRLRQARSEGG
jgi:hypothetical protein